MRRSFSASLVTPGEPVSVSVDSDDSTLDLSKLTPGSAYEVSVISLLGLDESDPTRDLVATRESRSVFLMWVLLFVSLIHKS